jgi:integrase
MEFVEPIRDRKKIEAMKKILHADSIRNYVLFVLGINSGIRISDLCSLMDLDVKEDSGKIKERIVIREKKTGKVKNYPINESAKKALIEFLGEKKPEGKFIFASKKGRQPITRVQAYRILNDAANLVGIPRIGTHSLRKTFGYHAHKNGTSITLLQKLFNHETQKDTLKYIGITQDEIDEVYVNINL